MGVIRGVGDDGNCNYIEGGGNMKTLHLYKIYTPRDVAKFILRKEGDIINLLEKKKTIGRKIMGFWYIRGKEVIEIQKLMKGKRKEDAKDSSNRGKSQRLATKKGQGQE